MRGKEGEGWRGEGVWEGGECTCTSSLDDMSRTAQCSHLRKNSNNQRKLTMSSDRFPS